MPMPSRPSDIGSGTAEAVRVASAKVKSPPVLATVTLILPSAFRSE